MTFIIGNKYSKHDAIKKIDPSKEITKWGYMAKGYFSIKDVFLIFADLNSEKYNNEFLGNNIFSWDARNKTTIEQNEIKRLMDDDATVLLFIKDFNNKHQYEYKGKCLVNKVFNEANKVHFIWNVDCVNY